MPLPKITIGLDAASRAKYKSNLAAQLSFFSITQTDDPIPRTNFTFSVYYVLGALGALLYALLDPSCVNVTAYRRNVPIDDCTSMLATFACRTADFDPATGAGFTRTYNSLTCLGGKSTSEERTGAFPPSLCSEFQDATFKCKTADYDKDAGTGFERTFSPLACPTTGDGFFPSFFSDSHPPSTCASFEEASFTCRTSDYDAAASTGYERNFTTSTCPKDGTFDLPLSGTYPASTCASIQEDNFECRSAEYDSAKPNDYAKTFTPANCPADGSGTAPVFGWYPASSCGSLAEFRDSAVTNLKCRRASECGFDVAGTVEDGFVSYGGTGPDTPYDLNRGVTSNDSCEECVKTRELYDPYQNFDVYNDAYGCRKFYGLCCGLEPGWYAGWGDGNGWLAAFDDYMGWFNWTANYFETGSYEPFCPTGSMSLPGNTCAATGKTACACPTQVQTGRTVAKSACGDPQAIDDYNTCGRACGKTYDSSSGKWDVGGTEFVGISGAAETSEVTHFTYEECEGTLEVPVTFTTCSGTRGIPVTFTTCSGTRDIPVVYDSCEGTVIYDDVQYTLCDGFVTICPETPMSVRFSQAMAYSAAWMSALAFVYNYLGQRELAKRMDAVVQKNDLADESDDEDAPADAAKGAKTDDVTATVKLRNGRANRV